jgi:hypothetical protein
MPLFGRTARCLRQVHFKGKITQEIAGQMSNVRMRLRFRSFCHFSSFLFSLSSVCRDCLLKFGLNRVPQKKAFENSIIQLRLFGVRRELRLQRRN